MKQQWLVIKFAFKYFSYLEKSYKEKQMWGDQEKWILYNLPHKYHAMHEKYYWRRHAQGSIDQMPQDRFEHHRINHHAWDVFYNTHEISYSFPLLVNFSNFLMILYLYIMLVMMWKRPISLSLLTSVKGVSIYKKKKEKKKEAP